MVFGWRAAVVFYIGPVEAGIIVEAALRIYMGSIFSRIYQLLCFDQPFDGQIGLDGNAGGLAKFPAKLGFADIESLTNIRKRNGFFHILIEIAYDAVRHRIGDGIGFLREIFVDAAKLMQQRDHSGKNADPGIRMGGHHRVEIVFAAAMAKKMAFIQILLARDVGKKGREQMPVGIYGLQNLRIKVQYLSLVGLGKIQLDVVRFRRLHDQQVSAFQRVGTAFNMEGTGAFDKIIEFHPVMGVQHKTGLVRSGAQTMRETEIIIDRAIKRQHNASPKLSIQRIGNFCNTYLYFYQWYCK